MTDVVTKNEMQELVFEISDGEYDVPVGVYRLVLYLASLITPIGLALGMYYHVKGDDGYRFARNCTALGLVPVVLLVAGLAYAFLFFTMKY
ncbi:MAG TPA: hypothetical protein HA257_05640 [Candidatus Methanoperedenaceae archaeon]|nr:hypothetical protein [Candidatus Methanoperedenaceae archaeon]